HAFHNGVALKREDRMLATLPFFHSFGYTVCLWAPAGIGMLVVFYPDPRAGKEIGELCLKHQCTIQLGTATFLRFYLRRSSPSDFQSLRLLICGAEKLPVSLAQEFAAKFGILPLEGYGCTETAPAVSLNLPDTVTPGCRQMSHRPGSIGLPIPGVVVKAFDPDTLAPLPVGTEGVLGVLGPNVMLGYFQQPERTAAAIHHGWYITGDMGVVEPEGFLRITGRISRFAKIAGEMIPLEKVEELLQEALGGGDRQITVCSVPDDKRGERLVMLVLPDVVPNLPAALATLPGRGLPNLWIPDKRDFFVVEQFPILGTGKLDLRAVSELARSLALAARS
ncbi:MAG: AMP-binding protein, partial [Gemmataceae bacterium]